MTDTLLSYTNSDGMVIDVSSEHLDKAIDIKLELQELSPSRRCPWNRHKQMMEQEGFNDSDTNESYRCLIKRYQKSVGKLSPVYKYADYVAEGKLDAIKKAVGEMYYEKMDNQKIMRELNKIKKDLTTSALAVEELKQVYIDDIDFSVPHYVYNPKFETSKNKAILIITDWHIGVKVNNCLGNFYNYEIAKKRINKLKQETLDRCRLHNVTELHVCGLGDWVEHLYMRQNQSQDCEFGKSMQTAKAEKLILDLLVSLGEYINVTYMGIAGNHDREAGDKTQSFDGDNANVVINEGIKDMLDLIKSPRITYVHIDPHEYYMTLELNGKKFKLGHGDKDNGNKKDRMKGHIVLDKEFYDCFIHGHLHNFYVQESDDGRIVIGVGCLMGRNNYSKDMLCATDAGQALIIVREDGDIQPQRINLQIV